MKLKTLVYLSLITLVASLSPAAHAQTFSVIHSFTGPEGAYPYAGVTLHGGILFGTTNQGGTGWGTVYQVTQEGSNWLTIPVYLFGSNGFYPRARVVFGPDGHPYGTTADTNFMSSNVHYGTVFDLTPQTMICKTASCFWIDNVLYSFLDYPTDGAAPSGDLVWDREGNIYGTTENGGNPTDFGTVFEMTKSGNLWTEKPIWLFSGVDGAFPRDGVVFDSSGDLLGTAEEGGAHDGGTIFKLTRSGNSWTETVLHDFEGGEDGDLPFAGLVIDGSGNIYGATSNAGAGGGGTIFELIPSGNSYTYKLLYSFGGELNSQCGPWASLSIDAAGNLYGTTICDGRYQDGNVFKLTNTENGWVYTSLYDFTGGSDGREPFSNVTIDADGTLYGTTTNAGNRNYCYPAGCGTVWMIKP